MPFTIPTVYTAVDKMSAVVAQMGRNVKAFALNAGSHIASLDRKMRKLSAPVDKLTQKLGGLGIALGAGAAIGVVGNAINVFKDFEQANANLAAALETNISGVKALSKDAKRLGASTAFTAAEVTALQTEYAKLGFTQQEILNATAPALSLAAATNIDLAQAATQVGSALRAFGLDASNATRVANVFASASAKTALDMQDFNVAMGIVAPVAKKFGFSIEDTSALLGALKDSGFDASMAATSLRSILLNLADSNGKLAKSLGKPVKDLPSLLAGLQKLDKKGISLAKTLDLTDKQSVAAFSTFMSGTAHVEELATALYKADGAAQKMADTQMNTLGGSLKLLRGAWQGYILSLEDGTGKHAATIRSIVSVAIEMLKLASNTAVATDKLTQKEMRVRSLAERALFFGKVIFWLVAAFYALKLAIFIAQAAMIPYNIILGASIALQGKSALYLIGNTLAYKSYRAVVVVATAAQWLWNAAMSANPIGLIIIGIAGLIGLIVAVIKYWDSWGETVSVFLGPLGFVISLIQSIRRNWDLLKKAFSSGGILEGIKMIGKVLLDAVLSPLQKILELAGKLPGKMGQWAREGANSVENFRASLGVNMPENATTQQTAAVVDPRTETYKQTVQTNNNNNNQNVAINIKDQTGRASVKSDNNLVPVLLTSTNQKF